MTKLSAFVTGYSVLLVKCSVSILLYPTMSRIVTTQPSRTEQQCERPFWNHETHTHCRPSFGSNYSVPCHFLRLHRILTRLDIIMVIKLRYIKNDYDVVSCTLIWIAGIADLSFATAVLSGLTFTLLSVHVDMCSQIRSPAYKRTHICPKLSHLPPTLEKPVDGLNIFCFHYWSNLYTNWFSK